MSNLENAANKFGDFINKLQKPNITSITLYDYGECDMSFCYMMNGEEIEESHLKIDIAGAIGLDVERKTTEFLDGSTMTYDSNDFIEGVLDHEYGFNKDDIREFIEGGLDA